MKLVIEQGTAVGQVFVLEQPSVVVGRGGEATDERIVLPAQGASRQHARLEHGPDGWTLTDLGSTNGTFLNGQQIGPHESHLLRSGDRIGVGGALLAVHEAEADLYNDVEAGPAGRLHPAVLAVGAFAVILVLVAIVVALVLLLQPKTEDMPTATPGDLQEQIMTVVPTEFQDMATAIMPLIPTDLPLPLFGPTATPEAAAPQGGAAGVDPGISVNGVGE